MTGAGLPVVLVPHPSDRFNFLTCVAGKRKDMLCVLQNLCPQLPVKFRFRKLAHFCAEPSDGTISPGQCKVNLRIDLVVCFINPSKTVTVGYFFMMGSTGCSSVFHCTAARDISGASEDRRLRSCCSEG